MEQEVGTESFCTLYKKITGLKEERSVERVRSSYSNLATSHGRHRFCRVSGNQRCHFLAPFLPDEGLVPHSSKPFSIITHSG